MNRVWVYTITLIASGVIPPINWKRADLLDAFRQLATLDLTSTQFCFFVDGLDEYFGDNPDDYDELTETIQYLTKFNVKICVASRPLNVFEEAFGQIPECKIYMQDLNEADIELYVDKKLRTLPNFQALQISTLQADEITAEIVNKPQGVFLWVYLVVRSLIEGVRNQDRLTQLQRRLKAFPADLDEFFSHIYRTLDPTYRTEATHMFIFALAAQERMSSILYWFLDEEEDKPEIALVAPIQALSPEDFEHQTNQIKIRVNGRCKGLLEVTSHKNEPYVDFLHRTVRHYFLTTEMQQKFGEWQREDFDPDFAMCKATLAMLKCVATMEHGQAPHIFPSLESFLNAAKRLEVRHKMSLAP